MLFQVVIKYVPYVGDSKRAMDEYTSEIMMGGTNTIALHNTCEVSVSVKHVSEIGNSSTSEQFPVEEFKLLIAAEPNDQSSSSLSERGCGGGGSGVLQLTVNPS